MMTEGQSEAHRRTNQKHNVHCHKPLPPKRMYLREKATPLSGDSIWQKLPAGARQTHTPGSVCERSTMGQCVLILSSVQSSTQQRSTHCYSDTTQETANHIRTCCKKNPPYTCSIRSIAQALNSYNCTIVFCLFVCQ